MRTIALAMAKEYGAQGIRVRHFIIDGVIAGKKIKRHLPELAEKLGEEVMINIEGIVNSYSFLHNQSPPSWTLELDLHISIDEWYK